MVPTGKIQIILVKYSFIFTLLWIKDSSKLCPWISSHFMKKGTTLQKNDFLKLYINQFQNLPAQCSFITEVLII